MNILIQNYNIEVPHFIIEYCRRQVQLYNFGQRASGNGTKEQQLTGLIGECIVNVLFDRPLPSGEFGYDGGYDIEIYGKKFEIDSDNLIRVSNFDDLKKSIFEYYKIKN